MAFVEKPGIIVQRGARLLLLSSDGKKLERLITPTSIPPMPGLWVSTEIGDRLFLVDGGVDNGVFLGSGLRICVVDVQSGRQRILFSDGTIRDRLGRPVTDIEGADGSGLADWQLVGFRLLTGERVLHITMTHPIHGVSVCALDARSGVAVVTQSGTWRRMSTNRYSDERAGIVATVDRDAVDVPVIVTATESNARLVVGVPTGAIGKFSDVAISQDGKYVAVILAGNALYLIDVSRRTSRKVGGGSYSSPQWTRSGKVLNVLKQNVIGGKADLLELNLELQRERVLVSNVDAYKSVYRKLPDWITKSTP